MDLAAPKAGADLGDLPRCSQNPITKLDPVKFMNDTYISQKLDFN